MGGVVSAMREIKRAIIHTTATDPNWMEGQGAEAKRDEIDRWHKDKGWNGFGYHGLIDRPGDYIQGRPYHTQGAHVSGHNGDSIGVTLVGGRGSSADDEFSDNFTNEQEVALIEWMEEVNELFPGITFHGHNEFANRACPGFRVKDWMEMADLTETPNVFAELMKLIMKLLGR